ncbi:MAG TPA: 3-phosphoshikimate 1-carboxyvinyltransferase [Flavisolibacter sp.]|jgi:3-phosphoshikimate 1-carboxyvinyltransferase|nr:3-phosphoshikimate 1-carboxyvinyltransferase [Flavisolibacter sp.]
MQAIVTPTEISGSLTAAASKSAMQRACAAALIKGGKTTLTNPGRSADDLAALDIIKQLGASVREQEGTIRIESRGVVPVSDQIHCGESGLSVRMFTSLAALSDRPIHISGSGSLLKRPLHFFNEVLPQLQVSCSDHQGYLPLTIQGPLVPWDITIDGSLSSQYLTGLLFAYAAANARDVTIHVTNLASKPYIDLTLSLLDAFRLPVPQNQNYEAFYFSGMDQKSPQDITYQVEGDWSGAAFLLVAGAVSGSLEVRGLDVFSTQADKAILQALMQCGAGLSVEPERIHVRKLPLRPFQFDATDCPDLFPPLVALASFCEGTSVIEGVNRLTHKESNRALTLQQEFGKLGIEIVLQDNLMIIYGGQEVKAAAVHSHHDHRIAMACAVAALRATGPVTIDEAEAVNKSYPQFWEHLQSIAVPVTLHNT